MTDRAALLDSLLSEAGQVSHEEAVALLIQLARLQVALLTAASRPPVPVRHEAERPDEDHLLEVDEAAAMLGVTPRWLYRHANLPFVRRISRRVIRYSAAGIRRWLASRRP